MNHLAPLHPIETKPVISKRKLILITRGIYGRKKPSEGPNLNCEKRTELTKRVKSTLLPTQLKCGT